MCYLQENNNPIFETINDLFSSVNNLTTDFVYHQLKPKHPANEFFLRKSEFSDEDNNLLNTVDFARINCFPFSCPFNTTYAKMFPSEEIQFFENFHTAADKNSVFAFVPIFKNLYFLKNTKRCRIHRLDFIRNRQSILPKLQLSLKPDMRALLPACTLPSCIEHVLRPGEVIFIPLVNLMVNDYKIILPATLGYSILLYIFFTI